MGMKVPDRINNRTSLEILSMDISNLDLEQADYLDLQARAEWRERNATKAYYLRVIAARLFERAINEKDSFKSRMRKLQFAALAYDKAAKNAVVLGFVSAAMRCRVRSCLLHNQLLKTLELAQETTARSYSSEIESTKRDLRYAGSHILEILERNNADELENGIPSMNRAYKGKKEHCSPAVA